MMSRISVWIGYPNVPRYLTTLAAAEQLYDALYQWNKTGHLEVTSISLDFFRDFSATISTGIYQSSSDTYQSITSSIRNYADGYLRIVQLYTPPNGALSEQFSRDDGTPRSAADLTWSYASFLTAVARHAGHVPTSWGESTELLVPSICTATSATGTYAPAIPDSPCNKPAPTTVSLTFNALKPTIYGQNIFLTGSFPQLGLFDESQAVPLSANTYSGSNPRWYGTVKITAGTSFRYRYYLQEADGTVRAENGQDRTYRVPIGDCNGCVWVFDTYRG